MAKKRRMPDSKGFDFVVESSFVEVYSEECFDLYQKGDASGVMLPVRSIRPAACDVPSQVPASSS